MDAPEQALMPAARHRAPSWLPDCLSAPGIDRLVCLTAERTAAPSARGAKFGGCSVTLL